MGIEALAGRDLLAIADLSIEEMTAVLQLAADLKSGVLRPQSQKILGLLFYKASTRTRVSFTAAMYQLGGQVLDLNPSVTQVGRGEPIQDTAREYLLEMIVSWVNSFFIIMICTYQL